MLRCQKWMLRSQGEAEQKALSAVKREEKDWEKRSRNIRIRWLEESKNDAESFEDVCGQIGVAPKVRSRTRIDRKPQAGLREPQNRRANTQANDNTSQQPMHLVVTLETTRNRAELLMVSQSYRAWAIIGLHWSFLYTSWCKCVIRPSRRMQDTAIRVFILPHWQMDSLQVTKCTEEGNTFKRNLTKTCTGYAAKKFQSNTRNEHLPYKCQKPNRSEHTQKIIWYQYKKTQLIFYFWQRRG